MVKIPVQFDADVDFWALVRYLNNTELTALLRYAQRELRLRRERIEKGMDPEIVEAGRKS